MSSMTLWPRIRDEERWQTVGSHRPSHRPRRPYILYDPKRDEEIGRIISARKATKVNGGRMKKET